MYNVIGRYWDGQGKRQFEYNLMRKYEDAEKFKFLASSYKAFRSYYRYYNDGDIPGWAKSRWDIRGRTQWSEPCLTAEGEEEMEKRITKVIEDEWSRFLKSKNVIDFTSGKFVKAYNVTAETQRGYIRRWVVQVKANNQREAVAKAKALWEEKKMSDIGHGFNMRAKRISSFDFMYIEDWFFEIGLTQYPW